MKIFENFAHAQYAHQNLSGPALYWLVLNRLQQRTRRGSRSMREPVTDDEVIAAIRSVPAHWVDLSITAANVLSATSGNDVERGTAGATVTAGQTVYQDTGDANQYKLFDCDSATALARVLHGVALNGASDEQPCSVIRAGTLTINAVATVATIYVGSDTAGGIMPAADLEIGDYVSILGVGLTTATIGLKIYNSGVAVAA